MVGELAIDMKAMKQKMEELEAAIYSDTESYSPLNVEYEDVLTYYQDQSNAEEGL